VFYFLFYFYKKQFKENAVKNKANGFQKVFDSRNRRVRGLWQRNGAYYAQIRTVPGQPATKVHLHKATTVPQALTEMQALKQKRREGDLQIEKKRGVPKFCQVADAYIMSLSAMEAKHADTRKRESSSVGALKLYFTVRGDKPVNQITYGDTLSFAQWRKNKPMRRGLQAVSGRAIDVDIMIFRHVMDYAKTQGHIKINPIGNWKPLADKPKEVRLVPTEEVNQLIETAGQEIIGGQQFADYLTILAFSGGREQETLRLRWSVNVDWINRRLGFGQDGKSKRGKSRWVQFNPKLEAKLKEMFARRQENCDLLFPTPRPFAGKNPGELHPVKSYKKAMASLKIKCGTNGRLGFHHFRHYFISVCAMSDITMKTVQEWVGHEDLDLIARIYAHLTDKHKIEQAAKFNPDSATQTITVAKAA